MSFTALRSFRLAIAIIVLGAINFVAGRLGLLLAIPPGFASVVFPPAGIALACVLLYGYRIWPGVWLGSFCINLSLSLDAFTVAGLGAAAPVAAGIASGSSLQALAGAWLVRRYVGFPHALDNERAVTKFLWLGGPTSCVIGAVAGVATLRYAGLVADSDVLGNAGTWWVGDILGVLIFTPLVFITASAPHSLWRRRWIPVALPLAILFASVVVVYVQVSASEQQRIEHAFGERAAELASAVIDSIDGYLEIVYATEGLFAASQRVERDEFRRFAERLAVRHPGLQSLSWVPRVVHAERDEFEAAARRDGYSGFEIRQSNASTRRVRAKDKDEYFPVHYVAPQSGNAITLGNDMGFDPLRRKAMEQARDSGRLVATGEITLSQDKSYEAAIRVFDPIYRAGVRYDTIEERRAELLGFASGAFRIRDMVEAALRGLPRANIAFRLDDDTPGAQERELYRSGLVDAQRSHLASWPGLARSFPYTRHGRVWTLNFFATPEYLAAQGNWQAWKTCVAGLLFTGLLEAFLLVMTGKSAHIEELVAERTANLARKSAEVQLFYHTLSHELKTPLTAVREFVAILLDNLAGPLSSEQREYLSIAQQSCEQMRRMLDDLLDAARLETGKLSLDRRPACVGKLASEVLAGFAPLAREKGILLRDQIAAVLPEVRIDRHRIAQVLINLLGNALKFTESGGEVTLRVVPDPDPHWPHQILLSVSDTGKGIDEKHQEAIFDRLYQVQESDLSTGGGLGLGLSLCRGIVRLHGGEIWVKSRLGTGSTFFVTLPEYQRAAPNLPIASANA